MQSMFPVPRAWNTTKFFSRNPEMFEGLLPVVHRWSGNTIYRVPQRNTGLAHVVPETAIVRRVPIHGLDTEEIEHYVAALEDESLPLASFKQPNPHSAVILADIEPGQVISVQMTYHPGWKATINGARQSIHEDRSGDAGDPAGLPRALRNPARL